MLKKSLLIISILALGGCANLLGGRVCPLEETELKPLIVQIKKTPKAQPAGLIYFADGSARLTPDERQLLKQIATHARETGAVIKVVGHASARTRPTTELEHAMINLNISNRRALAVIETLAQAGVPMRRMHYEALSDSRPAKAEVNRAAEAANRRVEIFYMYRE